MNHDPGGILVVDDLAEQRLTIEATLGDLGERVVSVTSGMEALKYLLDHDVAVILLDVNMPEMDGFETAGLIRRRPRNANTPIIFLTADHDAMQAVRGYALGAVDYITCPFLPDVLRTKVSVFVALNRAQDRIREEADRRVALQREQAARAAAEEQNRHMRLLGDAGVIIAGSLDGVPFEDELLRVLATTFADEASVRFADRADGASCVWMRAGDGAGPAQPVPEGSAQLIQLSRVAITSATAAISDHDAMGRPRKIALPLTMFDRTMATLAVSRSEAEAGYSVEERELLRLIGERAAVALDNRRLYRELQERDRRKDEFLAMLSHELRNPLGAITAAAHLLEVVGWTDPKAIRACQVLSRQSAYLSRMVDDLLDVSRVTTGRITLSRVVLDLRALVDSTIDALRASGRLDEHTVTVTGDRTHIEADATRMEQVVTNLLVNAVKYTDPGGQIRIEVDTEGDQAVLRVMDEGIGITPELLENMFDLFVQGGQSLDRGQGGLGIGLTLVRKLVELQGGTVQGLSEGPGKGSTFVVRLPRVVEAQKPRLPEKQRVANMSLRVLLIDDNEDSREMLRVFFELKHHQVHEAGTGPDGVDTALRVRPDVALVDLGLPGFDGLEVTRRLRRDPRTCDMLIVALTGYGQPEDRRRSATAGFDAHLVKPVSPERLDDVVAAAVQRLAGRSVLPAPLAERAGPGVVGMRPPA